MHAQRFRVVSALVSLVVALSTICAAQTQGLPDPDAPAAAQEKFPHGRVMAPGSSIARPGDKGLRAHTHLQIFVPEQAVAPFVGPPFSGLGFETPASLACVYLLVPRTNSCNPNLVFANPTGGFGAIALVDAFHYPTALTDLQTFSAQFGVKAPNLTVVFAEHGIDWIIQATARMDQLAQPGVSPLLLDDHKLPLTPGEYVARNVRVTPLPVEHESPIPVLEALPSVPVLSSDYALNFNISGPACPSAALTSASAM